MDLSLLRDSLPPRNVVQEDKDLLNDFRAAALSVTTLYKSSLRNSKKAYNEGYATCLRDVLNFIQAGVSAEGRMAELGGNDGSGALGLNLNFDVDGKGMTIGRVMDWVEGRLELITGEDDEEQQGGTTAAGGTQDDEEPKPTKAKVAMESAKRMVSTKTKQQPQSGGAAPEIAQRPPGAVTSAQQATATAPPDRSSPPPTATDTYRQPTTIPPSSSPVSIRTSYPGSQQQGALTRSRSRASVSEKQQLRRLAPPSSSSQSQDPLTSDFTFAMPMFSHTASSGVPGAALRSDFDLFGATNGTSDITSAPPSAQSVLGTKRRHAAMVSEIANAQAGTNSATSASPTSPGGGRRRRGPSIASSGGASRSMVMHADDMEIEDEPARKRVARR